MTSTVDSEINALAVTVVGRPAPQGSKRLGEHGQLREQSAYLPAWRAAVKRATYQAYRNGGVDPATLPLIRGAVVVRVTFLLPPSMPVDGPPDLDKLLRSTWDGLTQARAWEDDGRVVASWADKRRPRDGEQPGALIEIWRAEL